MGLRYRRRIGFGVFRLNLSRSGASVSAKAGPVTINPTRRTAYVNLPGGSFYQTTLPRRRRRLVGTRAREIHDDAGIRIGLHDVRNRDNTFWSQAPLPWRWHTCTAWTSGHLSSGTLVERCACGGCRIDSGPWLAKNNRRKS